jgi:hypothetical protein
MVDSTEIIGRRQFDLYMKKSICRWSALSSELGMMELLSHSTDKVRW